MVMDTTRMFVFCARHARSAFLPVLCGNPSFVGSSRQCWHACDSKCCCSGTLRFVVAQNLSDCRGWRGGGGLRLITHAIGLEPLQRWAATISRDGAICRFLPAKATF